MTSKAVIETIRRMAFREPQAWVDQYPSATPLALDLLSKMLVFDQRKRITLVQALEHPYLAELHSRAREPICGLLFDWAYERDYPDEMPQALLQHFMYHEMLGIRMDQDIAGLNALPFNLPPLAAAPVSGGAGGGGVSCARAVVSRQLQPPRACQCPARRSLPSPPPPPPACPGGAARP